MPKQNPLTAAEKARILDLARQGRTRSSIAKEVGRALTTVARICRENDMTPAVVLSAPFVEARALSIKERQVAARERRLRIMELEDARQLDVLEGRATWRTRVKTQGGGEYFETVDFIPPDDARNNSSTAASHSSAFRNLAPLEVEVGIQEAKSMLDKVIESLDVPDE